MCVRIRAMNPRRRALLLFLLVLVAMGRTEAQGGTLSPSFYSSTCPNVERIVKQAVAAKFAQTFTTIPGTLRLFFHDCFVEGCDASMMIFSQSNDADKDALENLSIATDGFDTVIKAKDAVEAACPGVVSCADVIALAARDVVVLVGGPSFSVELGRSDGRVSHASRVPGKLPQPSFNLDQLNALFGKNGLSQTDLIALSGAHTLGFSHCTRILDRIYSVPVDPILDPDYAQELIAMCPRNPHPDLAINMDPTTPRVFDNGYYKNLENRKGLFRSDQVLFTDQRSRNVVTEFAARPDEFAQAFAAAMVKLGRVGVKTGTEGEVRRDCTSFN